MSSITKQKNNPHGWQRVMLGDISHLRKGLTYKSSHYSNEQDGMIFLTLKSIQRGGGFNTEGVKYYAGDFDKNAVVKEGDLVIANTDITRDAEVVGAPMLLPKLAKEPALISMDLSVLDIEKDKADNHYLYYLLQTPAARNFMRDHSSGSTVLHLKTKDVPNFSIAIPPLPEQKKIAEILAAVDEEIQKTEEIIIATEKLKRGLMKQLFTCGIGHGKLKNTELGEVPAEWRVVRLEEVAKVERGKFSHRPRNAPEFYGGDIPFIQTGEVVSSNGRIKKYTQSLNERGLAVSRLFPKGTIVLTIAANIGDTGILEFDSAFPDSLVGITVGSEMDNVFLEYYLRTRKGYLNSIATQSAQKNINLQKLNPMLVIKPPPSEQRKIAEILCSVDEKISNNQQLKAKLALLKKGLMQDMLSGRKRVKI